MLQINFADTSLEMALSGELFLVPLGNKPLPAHILTQI